MSVRRRPLTLAPLVLLGCAAVACGRFGATDPGASVDAGGAPADAPAPRDFVVEVRWPSKQELDPAADVRASKVRVVVSDASEPSRRVELGGALERGPFDVKAFTSTSLVDVVVEVRGADDRLLGYGERRRWDLRAGATVPVFARARLLYFVSNDRGDGQLRVLTLTPDDLAEPGMEETLAPLESLTEPSGLLMSDDGELLAEAGRQRLPSGAGPGQVAVFETASHARRATIALPFEPAGLARVGGGRSALALPAEAAQKTTFALVDLDAAAATELPTGFQGGALVARAHATSADGARVAVAADYVQASGSAAYLLVFDVASKHVTAVPLSPELTAARGVRFSPDGATLVVAGYAESASGSTGVIRAYDAKAPSAPTNAVRLAAGKTKVADLFLHPDGLHAWVDHETQYGQSSSCCGEMRVVDLATGAEVWASTYGAHGPEYELGAMLRFPYEPRRVIAGQTDDGNNVNGAFVDVTNGAGPPSPIETVTDDVGTVVEMATPFGHRL